jgi:CheY-like chemotaxis protein
MLMARKRALIVDDSKSARVILSRMLEKYDIEVDLAESAEQSIEYLKGNRPDAIFMDHLMPGMDGLQAVQAIKSNPQTAMIPIMMYTSQEGELYVGQARALGAMGVLPKQVRPVDVSKVLYELHLLPDRRDGDEPALAPVELVPQADAIPVGASPPGVRAAPAAVSVVSAAASADWSRRVEAAVREQSADLRRFIVASLDSFASRIVIDVRDLPVKAAAEPLPLAPPQLSAPPARRPFAAWIAAAAAALAATIAAVVFAVLWFQSRTEVAKAQSQIAGLAAANSELARARDDLTETVKDLTSAIAAPSQSAVSAVAAAPATAPWSRTELVPFGEAPLDHGRVDVLREVLGKLEAQGFRGVVKVTSYAGAYCLTGNAADGYVLANATLPVGKCDLIGNPAEEAAAGLQRQSLAFANLAASIRQRSGGAISVAADTAVNAHAAVAYPARAESANAGDWNKAAAANNRVEYVAQPSAVAAGSL